VRLRVSDNAEDSNPSQAVLHGTEDDPGYRTARASKAGKASQTPKAHIDALIRQAGKLTPADIARLRTLLPAPGAE
jgi:hypothetical protein